MKYTNIHGFNSLNKYVNFRLDNFSKKEVSFKTLFDEMFFEDNNIFYESSNGYKIDKVTYLESKKHVEALSSSISYLLKEFPYNSIIGIYLDNDLEWLETFWAILRSGFRPLLLNKRLSLEVLNKTLKDVKASAVISINEKFDVPTFYIDAIKVNTKTKEVGEFGSEILFMSSGTTSNIKICAYDAESLTNIIKQSHQIVLSNPLVKKHYDGELKLLTILPFYHIFGFVAIYTWFCFFGRTLVEIKSLSPEVIKYTISRHKVTHIFSVPLLWQKAYDTAIKTIKGEGEKTYKKFLKGLKIKKFLGNSPLGNLFSKVAFKEVREKMFGDSINFLISGGAFISSDVLEFFNAIGYHMSNGYGTTEIGITSVELSNKYSLLINGSIGKPLTGVNYSINEKSELCVSANSMSKYLIVDNKKIDDVKGYNTHDLLKEVNGHYYFTSREDDLIVSITGENLNPYLIEQALKVDKVDNVCLINGKNGELPVVLLEVNKYLTNEQIEEVLLQVKEKLVKAKLQSQIGKLEVVKGNLLTGDEFKLNRKRIESDYYGNRLNIYQKGQEEVSISDEITKVVKDAFEKALKKEIKDLEGDFFLDLGGTSLEFFSIVSILFNEFNIDVSKEGLTVNSVNSVSEVIKKKL